MSGVDVRVVLDELVADMGDTPGTTGHQVAQARDAVAELMDRVEARKRLRDEFREWSKANHGHPAPRDFMRRFTSSDDRVNSALARCRGAER